MMNLSFQDYFFGSLFVAFFVVLGYVILTAEPKWQECEKKGGVMLKSQGSYICVKVERI